VIARPRASAGAFGAAGGTRELEGREAEIERGGA
jgi:hypothetical protein